MPSSSTALAVPTEAETQIAKRFGALVAHSVDVATVADNTYKIPRVDGQMVRPDGMDDPTWNIHTDAMMATRNMPAYLSEHLRRVELAQKIAGNQHDGLPPIANFVVHLVQAKHYDVIDVSTAPDEKTQ